MEWRYCFVAVKGKPTPLEVCKENFWEGLCVNGNILSCEDTKGCEEFEDLCVKKPKETK